MASKLAKRILQKVTISRPKIENIKRLVMQMEGQKLKSNSEAVSMK